MGNYNLYSKPLSATLAGLALGLLTLTPEFDALVSEYTAETANATNTITVTAADVDAVIAIEVNGDSHTNGTSATWETGENEVVITVTKGAFSVIYTIIVTKTE